jgi:hypothetical protein
MKGSGLSHEKWVCFLGFFYIIIIIIIIIIINRLFSQPHTYL